MQVLEGARREAMQVHDGMTEMVLTVAPGHTLRAVARLMAEREVGAAVVMDPDGCEDGSYHGCGCGFTVHAGNGDAVFEAHQFREHLCALNHRNLARSRFHNFWIGGRNR